MLEAPKKQGREKETGPVKFIAHQLPKELLVDELVSLNTEKTTQMRVVDEGKT